jgi:flagellum-specific ATP synthase
MQRQDMAALRAEISSLRVSRVMGRVSAVQGNTLRISGLSSEARLGDRVDIRRRSGAPLTGEVIRLEASSVMVLPDSSLEGVALGDRVILGEAESIAPSAGWAETRPLRADPPAPARRRTLGARLETGMAAFNTVLPIVRGQRVGLFAGSGVGKSMLLGHLARHMQADVVVIALIGERGRELREFVEHVLGPEGMRRAVIVAATSDRSPLIRRRCAWAAMAVAEFFRDQGQQVLFLADSITRFAEAHREVATAAGEMPALRGFPASTSHLIMSLCERAGPGEDGSGDITALLTVLVAGSDMEEPIADILRGVLDGHVVLDRQIAERGRYPAIDLLRSVSRSLPRAATEEENALISSARGLLGSYARSETMIKAGLYSEGSDPGLDQAIKIWPELDGFLADKEAVSAKNSFARLGVILRRAGTPALRGAGR